MKDPTSILQSDLFPVVFMKCRSCGEALTKAQAVVHECDFSREKPIEGREEPMPKALDALESDAREYAELKVKLEQISDGMNILRERLEKSLAEQPDSEVEVTYLNGKGNEVTEVLYLCPMESKSLDWDSAKETLSKGELKVLKPFVSVVEKFEIKAAERLIDLSRFRKFIKVKKAIQLRFKKLGA